MWTKSIRSTLIWLAPCLLACTSPGLVASRADFDEIIDSPMYKTPELLPPPIYLVFSDKTKDLWMAALNRPEADLRCKAADAVALAQRRGVKGLESTIDPLVAVLDQPDQHPAVRLAVARTLIALDAGEKASPSLLRHSKAASGELRELIEPALARWDYQPARAMWLERLRDPAANQRSLMLAIQGLAGVKETEAVERLREIAVSDKTPRSIRLEASRALGKLRDSGLEADAERLSVDNSASGLLSRLIAAWLLRRHEGEKAVLLLQGLAEDREPAVAAPAVERLLEIEPGLVVPWAERLFAKETASADSTDANLRQSAVDALFHRPTEQRIRLLGDRLDDVNVSVRVKARKRLLQLAQNKDLDKKLPEAVISDAIRILNTSQWRGLEQATILLTLLDRKEAADRLVELLSHARPEVKVTSAWGLRKLDVEKTLPAVAKYADAQISRRVEARPTPLRDPVSESIDHQLSQLNQFIGRRTYKQAEAVLRKYIPRRPDNSWPESRAAAIWALGMIHEGKPDADLVALLDARLNDVGSQPPEDSRVRVMSAVSLGRMRAKDALPSLEAFCPDFEPSLDGATTACGWAIGQISGKKFPDPKPIRRPTRDWFLTSDE
jgi:hypothetical protein